jgi:SAM-dependent methyltransferase
VGAGEDTARTTVPPTEAGGRPGAHASPPPPPRAFGADESPTDPFLAPGKALPRPWELDTEPVLPLSSGAAERPRDVDATAPARPEGSPDPSEHRPEDGEDEEDDTVEIPSAIVEQAVRMALGAATEAANGSSQVSSAGDFDLDGPMVPGGTQALEDLARRQSPHVRVADENEGTGAGEEVEQANRVAILLSALRPKAKEAIPAARPGDEKAAETRATSRGEAAARAAVSEAPPSLGGIDGGAPELEEISGEELEEVSADAAPPDDEEGVTPPPIPDATLSPFEPEREKMPAVVRVPVVEVLEEDDAVMTSAPPEVPPSPPPPVAPVAVGPAATVGAASASGAAPSQREETQEGAAPAAAAASPAQAKAEPAAAEAGPPSAVSDRACPADSVAASVLDKAVTQPRGRKRKKAWFEEVFDEDWLRTLSPGSKEQLGTAVDFLEESLQPSAESAIIDLGCGDGRHAIELAGRGYQITGYDLSLPLLIRAADDAQRRDLRVNFIHGDFRELSFQEQFDAAYCVSTSFGYFDDESNRKVINAVNAALRAGGRFLLDVVNRDYVIRDLPARIWWEGSGCVVLEEVDFNYFTSRLSSKRSVVFEDGRHLEQEISVRCYSLHELGKILHHAGFRVLEVTGHLAHRTRFFGNCSRSIVLLAEKRTE